MTEQQLVKSLFQRHLHCKENEKMFRKPHETHANSRLTHTAVSKLLSIILIATLFSCRTKTNSYFDQPHPSATPRLFAPTIVNTDSIELNLVFNYNNTEMFFSRIIDNSFVLHHSEFSDGEWSDIKPIKMYNDSLSASIACDPTITKDGTTMYFLGVDPSLYDNDVTRQELYTIPPDIYKSKKVDGKWEIATKVEFSISTNYLETYPVVTADESLYFRSTRPSAEGGMHTYRAQYLGNEKFETPVIVDFKSEKRELITYVSPNEQYAITNAQGRFQLTCNKEGEWTTPKEIPLNYEDNWYYYCPYMSSDEKYFIYSRRYNKPNKKGWANVEKGEVYWVNADILFDSE